MEVVIQQKKKWRKYLYSKGSLAVLLILIIILAKASFTAHQRKLDVVDTAGRVSTEEQELLDRKAFLEGEIAKLSTPEGKESELRKKYGVARNGEQMAVIVESESGEESLATSSKKGWFASFIGFFGVK